MCEQNKNPDSIHLLLPGFLLVQFILLYNQFFSNHIVCNSCFYKIYT